MKKAPAFLAGLLLALCPLLFGASTSTDVIDGVSTSTAIKAPVRSVVTTNITTSGLSAISTIDGSLTPADGERWLLTGQTSGVNNGIYVSRSGAWERATDFDGTRDARDGTMVPTQAGSVYYLTTADPVVIGTNSLAFSVLSGTTFAGNLASTANGLGASLVGVEDAAGAITGTTVEAALTEVVLKAGTQTVTGAKTFSGATVISGAATISGATTISGEIQGASPLILEGATADAFETTLAVVDPTADATITFPNETGTVVTTLAASLKPLTSATVQATTSGTTKDFTGIPSWVQRITVSFAGVSLSGTDQVLVLLGDSGGVEASGYLSASSRMPSGGATATATSTAGFIVNTTVAAETLDAHVTLTRIDAATNNWVSSHAARANGGAAIVGSGTKALSATLDRVQITVSGVNTFDLGSVNILYE